MRFANLQFKKYGLLADREIDLPNGEFDLHVLAGPNEAGKSMMRVGIEDWLFGFHPRSQMAIGYQAALLRVGGTLRGDPTSSCLRKKGNKDTLVNAADQPISDAALLAALGSCPTREQFQQQHCLNHAALRAGGEALAGIGTDHQASSVIFETTSGVTGLAELVELLDRQADQYFSKRKRADVKFHVAEARHDTARTRLNEVRVLESRHATLKRNNKQADDTYRTLEVERADLLKKAARINRVLQLAHHVDAFRRAVTDLDALGDPVPMAPEKIAEAIEALQKLVQARSERETVTQQVQLALDALKDIDLNTSVDALADAIEQIGSEIAHVVQSRNDRPIQIALAEEGLDQIRRLSHGLGWQVAHSSDIAELDAIRGKLPPGNVRQATAKILQDVRAARAKLDTAIQTVIERESDRDTAQTRLASIPPAVDVSSLRALLKRARDHVARTPNTTQVEQLQQKMARIAEQLDGWSQPAEKLLAIKLPSQEEVRQVQQSLSDAEVAERDAQRGLAAIADDVEAAERHLQVVSQTGHAPPGREALDQARAERKQLWSGFRSGTKTIGDEGEAFEVLVQRADGIADERFDSAQAAHEVDAARADLIRKQEAHSHHRQLHIERCEGTQGLRADWKVVLVRLGLPYLVGPDLEHWRSQIQACREIQDQIDECRQQVQAFEAQSTELRLALRSAVPNAAEDATLGSLMDTLDGALGTRNAEDALRNEASETLRKARGQLDAATKVRAAADTRFGEESARWSVQLAQLGLHDSLDASVAELAVDTMATIEQTERSTRTALTRVRDMSATITGFDSRVAGLVKDLELEPSADAVATARLLGEHLKAYRAQRAKQEERKRQLDLQRSALRSADAAVQRADSKLAGLKALFCVDDEAALAEAAARHQQAAVLREQRDAAQKAVVQQAGAIPFEQVVGEVETADRELLLPEQQRIQSELDGVQEKLKDAVIARADCDRELAAVDGSEAAAIAETERVSALSEMEDSLAHFVQSKAGAIVLGWAVRKHRKRSQSPLLQRASGFFRELTDDRYEGFDIDDSGDKPILKAVPTGGQNWLAHDALSDGTLDVMYLALRLAALDLSAQGRPIPPLIADDLFINLDEGRARCGLKLLQRLSANFQVIFLTHQLGLVDVVRGACPGVNVQNMERLKIG
ncbi:MAG: AAA family ATPase [Panacagrimonas sp.]